MRENESTEIYNICHVRGKGTQPVTLGPICLLEQRATAELNDLLNNAKLHYSHY